jgi:UPF0716 protein FxsA
MRATLPLVLIAVPLTEIALFVLVGDAIGLWPTLALTVLAAGLGILLIRGRSLAALRRLRPDGTLQAVPMASVVDGAAVVAAGLLLIVPGFLTDLLGLSLLVPAVRRRLGRSLQGRFAAGAAPGARPGVVIDGEAVVVRDPPPPETPPPEPPPPEPPGDTIHLPPPSSREKS